MKLTSVRDFVRARLWRHLFLWFGMTIVASVLTTSAISVATHRWANNWPHRHFGDAVEYVAYQAGQAWEDPNALHGVLQEAQRSLQMNFVLQDSQHRIIDQVGDCRPPTSLGHSFLRALEHSSPIGGPPLLPGLMAPPRRGMAPPFGGQHSAMVVRHDMPVGFLVTCDMAPMPAPPVWSLALPLVVLVLMLGGAAYRVSQGLSRPLRDLVDVTRRIGEGDLASRVALQTPPPGEVGQLALAINDMATKIEKQIGDQRTLLAMVSHELRTPLARLRLLVELVQDPTQQQNALGEMEAEVVSIDNIVGVLLANARLDFAIVHRQTSDAETLLRRAVDSCTPAPTITVPQETSWQLSGDITLLARALANLVDNANKYGRGVAEARLRRVGDTIYFEMIDRGDGFKEDLLKVFDPFVRSPNAGKIDPTSMGLGLNLVKRVAEAHGGKAYCENLPQGGACVGFGVKL